MIEILTVLVLLILLFLVFDLLKSEREEHRYYGRRLTAPESSNNSKGLREIETPGLTYVNPSDSQASFMRPRVITDKTEFTDSSDWGKKISNGIETPHRVYETMPPVQSMGYEQYYKSYH